MSCNCIKKTSNERTDYSTLPDEQCSTCAEKHFSLAKRLMQESGYVAVNRQDIIGELTASTWHIYAYNMPIARKLRDLRHEIQERKEPELSKWNDICYDFEEILGYRIEQHLCNGENYPNFKENIWIISNCDYEKDNLVDAKKDDILIFLNKAKSLSWYENNLHKVVFHRSPKKDYGTDENKSAEHYYCFQDRFDNVSFIQKDFIKNLKSTYDWNYEIEEGKAKSMTTGYMVVKYIESIFPNAKLKLVNFGYKIEKSSYRCPWHNWEFEAKELENFEHVYTAKIKEE